MPYADGAMIFGVLVCGVLGGLALWGLVIIIVSLIRGHWWPE